MWANAQRDGHPAAYRWCPLFNAAKFGWRPLVECRAVTLPRRETRWNLQGCLRLTDTSQPVVGRSSPYYEDMWRRYCCLTSFFQLSISALDAKIWPDKVARWCRDGDFCVLYLQQAACTAARFRFKIRRTKATPSVEVWQTSNLRRLRLGEENKIEERKKKERWKPQDKNIMAPY